MCEEPRAELPDLCEHVLTRVLPFWERSSVDGDYGGFLTDLSRDGSVIESSTKPLVSQAHMVSSFAIGVEMGGPPQWLTIADQGAAFLLRRFRDADWDGWFWSTTREGQPLETEKRTRGHALVASALAEYGRTAHDAYSLAAAIHTLSLIADRLWDADHGGAIEACDRVWTPVETRHTVGTHLDLLEALLAVHDAIDGNPLWPSAREVADLIVTRMVHPEHGCALSSFHPDWTHDEEHDRGLVSYGNTLEAAWLLLRMHGVEESPSCRDAARRLLDYALEYGLDREHGGVFSHGLLGGAATAREKVWWVQTEAMVAFLLGHLIFGDQRYWESFLTVTRFCLRHLHDPEFGEWYHSTEEDGAPRETHKGSARKAAYHVTQACCWVHRYLGELGRPPRL